LITKKKPQRPERTEEKKQRKKTNPLPLVVPPNSPVGVLALQLIGCRHFEVGHIWVSGMDSPSGKVVVE